MDFRPKLITIRITVNTSLKIDLVGIITTADARDPSNMITSEPSGPIMERMAIMGRHKGLSYSAGGVRLNTGTPQTLKAHLRLHTKSEDGRKTIRWENSIRVQIAMDVMSFLLDDPDYIPSEPLADVTRVDRVIF